jgi:hypothetical protein
MISDAPFSVMNRLEEVASFTNKLVVVFPFPVAGSSPTTVSSLMGSTGCPTGDLSVLMPVVVMFRSNEFPDDNCDDDKYAPITPS